MWFRDDLRLRDNAALTYAASYGPVVCLFVEEENTGIRPVGAAAQWWRNRSILALKSELENHGAHLLIARGDPRDIVPAVAAQLHSRHDDVLVAWNRRYHAPFQEVDSSVKERLKEQGVEAQSFAGYLLTEPWLIWPRRMSETSSTVSRGRGAGRRPRGRRQAISRTRTWNLTALRANISRSFPHGSKDARAFRLSTPACANSGPPAPCTTV